MAHKPGPHPLPPSDFNEQTLTVRRMSAKTVWHRLHNQQRDAVHFGKSLACRFDDPEREYGVLYVSRHFEGAFAEVFLRDLGPYRFVTVELLENKVLSTIQANRGLKLVDLAGIGLARMGIDNRLATGSYKISQRWSRAFQIHTQQPDGILYRSRHYPRKLSAAIFETAQVDLKVKRLGTLREYLGKKGMHDILERYGVGLA